MLNVMSFEQMILDRNREIEGESRRASLLRQVTAARKAVVVDLSGRARAGLLLVRLGVRLAGAYMPQQQSAASLCVCVPGKN